MTREEMIEGLNKAIEALELIGTLKDRPCTACKHKKENGCCKRTCVFDKALYGTNEVD